MATRLNPYFNFPGTARQAMEFYQSVFGGELVINTFGQYGAPEGVDPDGVMHAMLETPGGLALMASDPPPGVTPSTGTAITISLSGEDGDELRGYWEKLAEGGEINVPLERQMWGDDFGQLTDRFGIAWMVNISGADTPGDS